MLTKDLAICIRAVDYSETSQVVTFFAKSAGKIGAMAKGSRRPKSAFGGPVEVLSSGQIVFTSTGGEKLATLTEFEQHSAFAPRLNDLFVLNCSLFAAELVDSMTDDYDPHPQLFDSFLQFLKNIRDCVNKSDAEALLILFQLSLLGEIGLQPVLKMCGNCRNDYNDRWVDVYFSSSANALICRDCEINFTDKIRLSKPAANCLADLHKIANTDEKTLNEIEKILIYHFTELLHRPPRLAKYILKA